MENGVKIFIVEDDLISAQYLKEMLEGEGFEVLGNADTGEKAVEALRSCPADVVLMDIVLKGPMTGSEAALRIKKMHPECRIIFLTAYADDEMIEYAVDAKAFAYLMKPYREREIVATIRTALANPAKKEETHDRIPLKKGFVYDHANRTLEKDGTPVPLTPPKLALVELLALNRDSVVSNEQLALYIWKEPKENSTLRSLITRFHATIGCDLISNVSGIGYTIETR
jgi:DNA-binding response OmpR family regulator